MQSGLVVRLLDGELSTYADLSRFGNGTQFRGCIVNDMVVDGEGFAYVNIYGLEPNGDDTGIILISPHGNVSVAAGGLARANGMAITPDRRTLIVAEIGTDHLSSVTPLMSAAISWNSRGDSFCSLASRRARPRIPRCRPSPGREPCPPSRTRHPCGSAG